MHVYTLTNQLISKTERDSHISSVGPPTNVSIRMKAKNLVRKGRYTESER